jgi:hypothetical protein
MKLRYIVVIYKLAVQESISTREWMNAENPCLYLPFLRLVYTDEYLQTMMSRFVNIKMKGMKHIKLDMYEYFSVYWEQACAQYQGSRRTLSRYTVTDNLVQQSISLVITKGCLPY